MGIWRHHRLKKGESFGRAGQGLSNQYLFGSREGIGHGHQDLYGRNKLGKTRFLLPPELACASPLAHLPLMVSVAPTASWMNPLLFSFSPHQLNNGSATEDTLPDRPDSILRSQDSTGSTSAEEALQIRDETPSVEASLDNANSQLPEVGRKGGWCMANLGSF